MCDQFICALTGSLTCYANDGNFIFYQDCLNCIKYTGKCSNCLFYDDELKFCIIKEREKYE